MGMSVFDTFRKLCAGQRHGAELSKAAIAVSNELRMISDHRAFEQKIRELDPSVVLLSAAEISKAKFSFIRSGAGSGGIQPLRKISYDHNGERKIVVEKIFLRNAHAIHRCLSVHKVLLSESEITPKINLVREGEALSAIYYDFIDGFIGRDIIKNELGKITKFLAALNLHFDKSKETEVSFRGTNFHSDFTARIERLSSDSDFFYKSAQDMNIDLEHSSILYALKRFHESKHVFSHGNPNPGNLIVTDSSVFLIDWDSWGLFPVGFDIAWLIFCESGALSHDLDTVSSAIKFVESEMLEHDIFDAADVEAAKFNILLVSALLDFQPAVEALNFGDMTLSRSVKSRLEALELE